MSQAVVSTVKRKLVITVRLLLEGLSGLSTFQKYSMVFILVFQISILMMVDYFKKEEEESNRRTWLIEGRLEMLGAIYDGDIALVRKLLDAGVDPNKPYYLYPLEFAIVWVGAPVSGQSNEAQSKEIVRLLVSRGASVNLYNAKSNPILYSALSTDKDIFQLILKAGADLNAKNRSGNPIIFDLIDKSAIDNGWYFRKGWYLEALELIISNGADLNIKNADGESVYCFALKEWNDCKDWEKKHNPDCKNCLERCDHKHRRVLELLVKAGAREEACAAN
ncbi:MAG: hypothetical protein AB1489_27235 [Acidobacteriota bacterium]